MNPVAHHLPTLLPKLWRFALRLTRHHDDAQDLVQRTCVRALERQQQWQAAHSSNGSPLSWLYTILHSIWLNETRSRRLHPVDSLARDADDEEQPLPDPQGADPAARAYFHQVVAAVDALPEAQRGVMLLVAVEGLSYREAAEVLGVPVGTVMSRLSRARLVSGQRFAGNANQGNVHVA
jgi:RNA polymerase sigma-70 factor, ECF subfamily